MVKSIVIDESANTTLLKLVDNFLVTTTPSNMSKSSKTGLLIGSIDQSKGDYITFVVSTPPPESETSSAESLNKSTDRDQQIDWFLNHALQVHDMLIGGMDILGIYCIDSTPALAKQLAIKLFKTLCDFEYYKQMKFNLERLVFLIESSTKSINMKYLDLESFISAGQEATATKVNFQPCDIKIDKHLLSDSFARLESNYSFNTKFKTPNIKSHSLLKEDFYNALSVEEMFDNEKYVCLINDTLYDETKPVCDSIKDLSDSSFATLMENLNCKTKTSETTKGSSTKGIEDDHNQNLDSIYELTGVCSLSVHFHKSFTLKRIKKLFIYDLMRSLYARVRLLVEDLDARKDIIGDVQLEDPNSNDASSIEESYQTPNRIHIHMNANNKNKLIISDYVFPDETDADISERIKQLFNYDIIDYEKEIIYVEELPPEIKQSKLEKEDNMDKASSGSSLSSSSLHLNSNQFQATSKTANKPSILNNALFYATSAIVAAGSFLFAIYSYKAANFINDDNEV